MQEQPNLQNPAPPAWPPAPAPEPVFPLGKWELLFGLGVLLFSLLLCNSLMAAGPHLGFALGSLGVMGCTFGWLWSRGLRPGKYAAALLLLSLAILAAFPRSDDPVLKSLVLMALPILSSLAFCLAAGQNRRDPAGAASLLDGPRTIFSLGIGQMPASFRGVRDACKSTGPVGKKGGAVALGLLLAIPLAAILVPLLMRADAAFEGLLSLLPPFRWDEAISTVILGGGLGCVLFTRAAALCHLPKPSGAAKPRKRLSAITVNTALTAVALIYLVYLFSQLAYFIGGFSGILPRNFTLAQYARRGFFEMAWLCAVNLGIIALALSLLAREKPLSTRLLCLFLGLVTLFLVAAASAKMLLYIRSFGLTRLRLLTQIFMVFLACAAVFVCVWLFHPKTPYMELTVVLGLALCAGLMWADVDTQVARYNVRAYQSGRLETVDVEYLAALNFGAVPYLEDLTRDENPQVAADAKAALHRKLNILPESDVRGWNWAREQARPILEAYTDAASRR